MKRNVFAKSGIANKLLACVAAVVLLCLSGCGTADNYVWRVKPKIKTDNIGVALCWRPLIFDYDLDDENNDEDEFAWYYTEDTNSIGLHKYDSLSVMEYDGKLGMIDYDGNIVVEPKFNEISAGYDQAYYIVSDDEEKTEEYTLTPADELYPVSDSDFITGSAPDDYYVWVDGYGIYLLYDGTLMQVKGEFSESAALLYNDGSSYKDDPNGLEFSSIDEEDRYILIHNGKPVNKETYEKAGNFADGIIPVFNGEKWGYVNTKGEVVIPFEYDGCWKDWEFSILNFDEDDMPVPRAYNFSDGYVVVSKNGEFGLLDAEGNTVIDFGTFEEIRPVYYGMCWVKSNGLWGVISLRDK